MGVLSALPIVSAGNLCCCLWVVSGGLVAAYVLQQSSAAPISAGDGALVGLLAGLCGAVVQLVISIPIDLLMAPMERAMAGRLFDLAQNMSPEMRDWVDRFSRPGEPLTFALIALRRLIFFFIMLCIGVAFSTAGGLIGAVIFAKKTPPAGGTIDVPAS